jgi:hypothetical protein
MNDHRKKNNKNDTGTNTNAVVSVVLRLINSYSRASNYVIYRIRPQSEQELAEQAGNFLFITPGRPQITIGGTDKKAFTFGLFSDKAQIKNDKI